MFSPEPELVQTHLTTLLQFLITTYFSQLSSVLIVHNSSSSSSTLQRQYLNGIEESFNNSIQRLIGLQWIDVAHLDEVDFEEQILNAANMHTEGFITILPNTVEFLHSRYYATRNSNPRLKDKFYLFLCEDENPLELLSNELLQFYPHHLMVVPKQPSTNTVTSEQEKQISRLTETLEPKSLSKFPTNMKNTSRHPGSNVSNSTLSCRLHPWSASLSLLQLNATTPQCGHRDINFELWTQKFVGGNTDGNLNGLLLDVFLPNETFAKNVELYPNKLRNLHGRIVRVGSVTYRPYVVTNYVEGGKGDLDSNDPDRPPLSVFYKGSEANAMITFCELHNCKLLITPYGDDNWGVINETGESTGMMGAIYRQEVELAIGCIYNWYKDIFEVSNPIFRSAVTILGPAPTQYPAWRTAIIPFTFGLWIFVILTMVFCTFILYLIKYISFKTSNGKNKPIIKFGHLSEFRFSMVNIFAVFIQQPSASLTLNQLSGRIFLSFLLCATITLENTYSGQLKSLLTIPIYLEPVDTTQKWAEKGWKWGAPSFIWIQSILESTVSKEYILTRNFEVRDYEFLYNASYRYDYGLGLERLHCRSYTFGKYITKSALENRIILKDDIYFDWTVAVSIKGWPLMHLFNKHVRTLLERGILQHWERTSVRKLMDNEINNILLNLLSNNTPKKQLKSLTIKNISGALFALFLGYIIASIALILEVFGHTVKIKFFAIRENFRERL